MTNHVSIWDNPSEQQQTDSTASTTTTTTSVGGDERPSFDERQTESAHSTASEAAAASEMNPIAAALEASNWSRDDVELALQVANLALLAYFVLQWRKIHV